MQHAALCHLCYTRILMRAIKRVNYWAMIAEGSTSEHSMEYLYDEAWKPAGMTQGRSSGDAAEPGSHAW